MLAIASGLRGGTLGMSQPLMISILSRATGRESQGKGVGLRATANRLTATIIPVVMGVIADAVGVGNSFFIVGGTVIGLLLVVALLVHRSGAFAGGSGTGTEAP